MIATPLSEKEKIRLKEKIKEACKKALEQRMGSAMQAMQLAQEAANHSEKSSAGDKYETARAMAQLDRDMNARQVESAKQELTFLNSIDTTKLYSHAVPGAVLMCEDEIFFIAVGLGALVVDNHKIILLSSKAPLALLLAGKKKQDKVLFNKKTMNISEVF